MGMEEDYVEDDTTIYVLVETDGYDAYTVMLATTYRRNVETYMQNFPASKPDYYQLTTWLNGSVADTESFFGEEN